jgi:hypothetical protein
MQEMQIKRSPALQQLLSEKYYYVTLNAESRQPIVFNDTAYTFLPSGAHGIHTLALKLMPPPLSYPAWVILDASYQPKTFHAGMLKSTRLLDLLRL